MAMAAATAVRQIVDAPEQLFFPSTNG